MSTEAPLTGWAAPKAEPIPAVSVSSELPGTERHVGCFGLTAGPGTPGLGGNPGRAKQLGLMNLGLESVLHSAGLSFSF